MARCFFPALIHLSHVTVALWSLLSNNSCGFCSWSPRSGLYCTNTSRLWLQHLVGKSTSAFQSRLGENGGPSSLSLPPTHIHRHTHRASLQSGWDTVFGACRSFIIDQIQLLSSTDHLEKHFCLLRQLSQNSQLPSLINNNLLDMKNAYNS